MSHLFSIVLLVSLRVLVPALVCSWAPVLCLFLSFFFFFWGGVGANFGNSLVPRCQVTMGKQGILFWLVDFQGETFPKNGQKMTKGNGSNPRTPSEHPNPHENRLPQNGIPLVLTHRQKCPAGQLLSPSPQAGGPRIPGSLRSM